MQGESSHTCTTEPFAARVGPRAMRMLIRAHENAARGHIAFSHFGDAAAVLSARVLVNKRWHASISQGSCICTSYTCTCITLYTTCGCTYARAAQCTPTRAVGHRIPANEPCRRSTAWLQPPHASIQWPKLVFRGNSRLCAACTMP